MDQGTVQRDRCNTKEKILRVYFGVNPTWNSGIFIMKYRMIDALFEWNMDEDLKKDKYFIDRNGAFFRPGVSELQKVIAAIRMQATGNSSVECN